MELKERLLELIDEKNSLFFELKEAVSEERKEKIRNRIKKIDDVLIRYRNVLDEEPVMVGEKIDLYKYILEEDERYMICLHGTKEIIGNIDYMGERKLSKDFFGNIGYGVNPEHKRKGYVSEALKLLTDKLYKEGISKVYISTLKTNVASRGLVEKFGGKLLPKYSKNLLVYECDLNVIKNKNKKR